MVACAVLVGGGGLVGCRATAEAPPDDMDVDLAVGGDDLGAVDAAVGDMACATIGPEVCGNGCDDDRNGYTDDDDPACTSQMLVTLELGTPALWRLILEPTPHVVALDGNPVATNGGMATYDATFAPAAFLAYDSATKVLERRPIGGAGGAATSTNTAYSTRDVCVFNGELIVVDPRSAGSLLHRFKPDGSTELGMVAVANVATACSSDGTMLYVATHPSLGDSVIAVFGKGASGPVDTGTTILLPTALLTAGYTRLVDLVYVKKSHSFIGLFAIPGATTADSSLNGDVMAPFGFDGGVGGFIDGGVWHGAGEFMP